MLISILELFIKLILKVYRFVISPLLGSVGCGCRYLPTCSHYAEEAIEKHGPINGGKLTLMRLLHCHPFGGEGFDPVPKKIMKKK